MRVYIFPGAKKVEISSGKGWFWEVMKVRGPSNRRFSYRSVLPTVLIVGVLLPFLFIRAAFLALDGTPAKCSSTISKYNLTSSFFCYNSISPCVSVNGTIWRFYQSEWFLMSIRLAVSCVWGILTVRLLVQIALDGDLGLGFSAEAMPLRPISKMGRISPRLPIFCLNRLVTRVRVRSPPVEPKRISNAIKTDQSGGNEESGEKQANEGAKTGFRFGRKIMIVVDSSPEAKGALQWALTHTVQNQDTIVLLYVTKLLNQADSQEGANARGFELLHAMKDTCHIKRPEVQVEVAVVGGKEKGPTIVEEARKQAISLLVLGQRKRSTTWRLLMTWAGSRMNGGIVEYCINNADCMTLAVRRKSRKLGGYLITTKRHKDFWLLA